MAKRLPILEEREQTHGDFAKNAQVSQDIKTVMRHASYLSLSAVHVECLDLIATKISRILSGNSKVQDHWEDIAGYAKLAVEACE